MLEIIQPTLRKIEFTYGSLDEKMYLVSNQVMYVLTLA